LNDPAHHPNDGDITEERENDASKMTHTLEGPASNAEKPRMSVRSVNVVGQASIKLLTINMFMRPVVNTNGTDHKEGRLKYFADRYLGQYDIICF